MRRNIGAMRHRVEVYTIVRTPDDIGGATRSDTLLATVYASIDTVKANELYKFSQIDKRVTHKLVVRYRSDFVRGQKLVWGSRQFYVDGVIDPSPTQTKEWLNLFVTEGGTE
jgi:SPP1 family predicted phage head-tail adaptor